MCADPTAQTSYRVNEIDDSTEQELVCIPSKTQELHLKQEPPPEIPVLTAATQQIFQESLGIEVYQHENKSEF